MPFPFSADWGDDVDDDVSGELIMCPTLEEQEQRGQQAFDFMTPPDEMAVTDGEDESGNERMAS